jgi:mannose-6-phosphate isomerase
MAASDNVLRGGLTPKNIDVGELLRVLRFDTTEAIAISPAPCTSSPRHREELYPTDAAEFALTRVTLDETVWRPPVPQGPEILLVTAGSVTVLSASASVELGPSDSAFVAAGEGYEIQGNGVVFRAAVNAHAESRTYLKNGPLENPPAR